MTSGGEFRQESILAKILAILVRRIWIDSRKRKCEAQKLNGGESIDSGRISLQESEWILATLDEILPLRLGLRISILFVKLWYVVLIHWVFAEFFCMHLYYYLKSSNMLLCKTVLIIFVLYDSVPLNEVQCSNVLPKAKFHSVIAINLINIGYIGISPIVN